MKKGRLPVRRIEEPEGWKEAVVIGSSGMWSVWRRGLSVPSICEWGVSEGERGEEEDVLGRGGGDGQRWRSRGLELEGGIRQRRRLTALRTTVSSETSLRRPRTRLTEVASAWFASLTRSISIPPAFSNPRLGAFFAPPVVRKRSSTSSSSALFSSSLSSSSESVSPVRPAALARFSNTFLLASVAHAGAGCIFSNLRQTISCTPNQVGKSYALPPQPPLILQSSYDIFPRIHAQLSEPRDVLERDGELFVGRVVPGGLAAVRGLEDRGGGDGGGGGVFGIGIGVGTGVGEVGERGGGGRDVDEEELQKKGQRVLWLRVSASCSSSRWFLRSS